MPYVTYFTFLAYFAIIAKIDAVHLFTFFTDFYLCVHKMHCMYHAWPKLYGNSKHFLYYSTLLIL